MCVSVYVYVREKERERFVFVGPSTHSLDGLGSPGHQTRQCVSDIP